VVSLRSTPSIALKALGLTHRAKERGKRMAAARSSNNRREVCMESLLMGGTGVAARAGFAQRLM